MERKVEEILQRRITLEGAGVKLKRVPGNDKKSTLDPFFFWTILDQITLGTTSRVFLGTPIGEWKR